MFRPNDLVSVYLDDQRPLPTELMYLVLQFSGLVRVGHNSVHFWVNWPRHRVVKRPLLRSARLSH